MIALRPEQLLKVVVGARQAGYGIAVEQTGPVTAGHLTEVPDSVGQRSRSVAVAVHGGEQPVKTAPDDRGTVRLAVVQNVCRLVHPGVSARHIRPERCGALQATCDQPLQSRQERRRVLPPLAVARSRLAATFTSRPLSARPEAASGARPSSVIALRTAAQ